MLVKSLDEMFEKCTAEAGGLSELQPLMIIG
jgi:hypothetical protein